ncbi:LysR family transcriptional regulator [Nocardioides panaciterrulae]|uniref:DNA-binding transcriptional LysR family regulator n=1 Tax=Nocardioides panaciterrulae TaxID=661492 RepID=A0A7Y9E8R8_9ACTN|nr:LysR substrate-binding domain-containing protein [Nocardioides panaciterrulae]NYD43245.1 DNA-binding transcriptional LysR family regulator [Nocardioides panaciterrulae]
MLPAWTPELATLDLLLSVAELGSVGKAAAAHGMSQPSASARLSRLERQLAVPLLARSAHGTGLTPNGEAVVAWAGDVVKAARTLTEGVRALQAVGQSRLRVAASLTVAEYCLPLWLLSLRRTHATADVGVTVSNSRGVCERVRNGQADLGFIESPTVPAGFTTRAVGSDRLALVVSPRFPLAARAAQGLRARDLPDLPLLLRERGSGTREAFLAGLAESLGEEPDARHAVELGSTSMILATARASGGVGVVSARAAATDLAAGTLVEVPVHDLVADRPLTALWLGREPTPLARDLVALADAV